jgi:hypothetical protein
MFVQIRMAPCACTTTGCPICPCRSFDIAREEAANAPAIDGRFRAGPLMG